MRYFYKSKGYYYFGFGFDRQLMAELKPLYARYNPANKEWYVEAELFNLQSIKRIISKYGFEEVDPSIERPFDGALSRVPEMISRKDIEGFLPELGLLRQPRPYQIDAVYYMANHGNCINGSDCGLGKTGCTVCYCELLDIFPVLVVCPSTVKSGWKKEWAKWNPNRKVVIVSSTDKSIDRTADVTVINYDILGNKDPKDGSIKIRFPDLMKIKFSLIVGDEIHFLKNSSSIRSKAFKKLTSKIPVVIGLSGTLILNRPSELVNILRVIKRFNEIFPDSMYYLQRYCNAKATRFGLDTTDSSNIKELNRILSHYCYFRKEKREVLDELPPTVDELVDCKINNKKIYKQAEKEFLEFLRLADKEKLSAAMRAEQLVKLNYLKQLSIEGKSKEIVSWLKDWCESNEDSKIIVFGMHREPLKSLFEKFPDSRLVTGQNSLKDKEKYLNDFKTNPKVQVLFANIQCIGTGVDGLQDICSNMAIVELPDRPTDLDQAISRLERSGQTSSVNVYYLLSDETIDKRLWKVLKEKKSVTDVTNKGFEDDLSLRLINDYKDHNRG